MNISATNVILFKIVEGQTVPLDEDCSKKMEYHALKLYKKRF